MLARHTDLPRTMEGLHKEFQEVIDPRYVDPEGKFYWRYNEATFNFSEHAGTSLREVPRGMLTWMLKKDFSEPVKQIVRDALAGIHAGIDDIHARGARLAGAGRRAPG